MIHVSVMTDVLQQAMCFRDYFCGYMQNTSFSGPPGCLSAFHWTKKCFWHFPHLKWFSTDFKSIDILGTETLWNFRIILSESLNYDYKIPDWPTRCFHIQKGHAVDNILQMGNHYFIASLSPAFHVFNSTFSFELKPAYFILLSGDICEEFGAPNIPSPL